MQMPISFNGTGCVSTVRSARAGFMIFFHSRNNFECKNYVPSIYLCKDCISFVYIVVFVVKTKDFIKTNIMLFCLYL